MGDGQHAERSASPSVVAHRLDAPGAVAQGVDVEAGVELVEDGDPRAQHGELQRLVALLLAAGQVDVERPVEEALVEADPAGLGAQQRVEPVGRPAAAGQRLGEHVVERHAGHLGRVLHHEVQAGDGPLPRRQGQHVDAVEGDDPPMHLVAGLAHDDAGQRGLAGAVRAHHGVHLAGRRP